MLKKYFGDKIFWKVTLALALPIALQNLLNSSFSLVDTIMVGSLNDVTLSAVGMAAQWNWGLNMFIFGICSGAAVFISQYWGIRDLKGVHKIMGIALISALLISLAFNFIGFFFPRGVISLFNSDVAVLNEGEKYLKIAAFSYPAVALGNVVCTTLRTTENVKLPMFTALFTTVLNGILDYGLIFGKFGLPQMGVRGAAIATCISAWSTPIIIVIISLIRKNILLAPIKDIFAIKLSELKMFYKRSLPVIFNEGAWGLGTMLYNMIFGHLGYEYFAAVTILRTFENISFAFFIGLCNACCVMVGKSIGSGKIERGISDARRFSFLLPLMSTVFSACIIIFRHSLVGVFSKLGTYSDLTITSAVIIITLFAIELPIRNIPYIQIVGIFRSGGDTFTGVKYDLVSLWLIALPATFIAAYLLNLPFVLVFATMYIFEDYIKTFLCIRHFKSKKWIKPVTEQGKQGLCEYLERNTAK